MLIQKTRVAPETIYTLKDLKSIFEERGIQDPYIDERIAIAHIYPFKATEHSLNLIDWDRYETDSVFHLVFPQPGMLDKKEVSALIKAESNGNLTAVINEIRKKKNPNPAKQDLNRPILVHPDGRKEIVQGMQHKYSETALIFAKPAQICFANCQYCFRAPQLWGSEDMFVETSPTRMLAYLKTQPKITDVLFTGGDPGIMGAQDWEQYLKPLLKPEFKHIQNIRIGTKGLTYNPQRFLNWPDTDALLKLFEELQAGEKSINFMSHFSSPNELKHPDTQKAIRRLRTIGVTIRSQTPMMKHINADADILSDKWKTEVKNGIIPYYQFIARDTGPREYYELTLEEAYNIFAKARRQVSGLCHSLRGPSMSASPGKVVILGFPIINGKKVMALKFLQARNPIWQKEVYFAESNPKAVWLDDLKPAFGESAFFYEDELENMYKEKEAQFEAIETSHPQVKTKKLRDQTPHD